MLDTPEWTQLILPCLPNCFLPPPPAESIIVLDTPESVQAFCKSQWSVDTDITGAAGGAVGAHLPATAANVSNMGLSDKSFTYSITKGAILDVSLTGGCWVGGAGRWWGVPGWGCGVLGRWHGAVLGGRCSGQPAQAGCWRRAPGAAVRCLATLERRNQQGTPSLPLLPWPAAGLNYATDPAMNKSFYGGRVTPQAILDGGVEPPEPMRELYAALDKVGAGVGVWHGVVCMGRCVSVG